MMGNLLSLVARRIVSAVICVAVFHFPKLFTATACIIYDVYYYNILEGFQENNEEQ